MCASWDNPGIAVISRESRDTLTEGNDPMIVCRSICDLLRENRPSGIVCQNLVTYRVGCTSNGWSHHKNLRTIARSVMEIF